MPFLTALFDLNGTATRKQALRVFLVLLFALVSLVLVRAFLPLAGRFVDPVVGMIVVWWFATMVRRLHDAGHSGGWALFLLVPYVGVLVAIWVLMLRGERPFNNSHAGLRAAGTAGLVLMAVLSLSRVFWAPYWSASEAMKPSVRVGDYLVTRYARPENLARGDVVVFRHPLTGVPMVARLIGLPGDRVQMAGGAVVLNEARIKQADAGLMSEPFLPQGPMRLLPRCTNGVVGIGGRCDLALLRESLPEGRSYLTGNLDDASFADNTETFTVPAGQLFLLGDHRDNSADSRLAQAAGGLGFVPAENVIGRVTRVVFSSAGTYLWQMWDWRGDRIFKAVE